jgi:hypothetical protein
MPKLQIDAVRCCKEDNTLILRKVYIVSTKTRSGVKARSDPAEIRSPQIDWDILLTLQERSTPH